MPLVATSSLPAYAALGREGLQLIKPEEAGIDRPLVNVGLLNLMPDAALRATDRQFLRLIEAYGSEADIAVHPFSVAASARGDAAREHIAKWYTQFADLRRLKIDALVITGANQQHVQLEEETFWAPLVDVVDWATANVPSVLCSCLATHAVIQHLFNETRVRLPAKMWGVFEHDIVAPNHPLVDGLDEPVSAPHSHYFDMSANQMESVGVTVLMQSAAAGVHMASVTHGCDWLFFQGHPEYDRVSLMKEFQREVTRFANGERDYPPYPANYFPESCEELLKRYQDAVLAAVKNAAGIPRLPENELTPLLANRWLKPGRQIFFNWLQRVSKP